MSLFSALFTLKRLSDVENALAVILFKVLLDVAGVRTGPWHDADDYAAVAEGFLISLRIAFRNAQADEAADDAAGDGSGAAARQGCDNWPGDDDAQAGKHHAGADGQDAAQGRADHGADGAANAH